MALIVACDNEYGIGKNNKLPWDVPEDLKHFKAFTANKPLIVGTKTYEGLPSRFIQRNNIIIVGKNHKSFDEAVEIA